MVFYGKHGPIETDEESYQNGYDTGFTWHDKWIPGGPWICPVGVLLSPNKDWEDYCNQTKRNNAQWMKGFRDGRNDSGNGPILT